MIDFSNSIYDDECKLKLYTHHIQGNNIIDYNHELIYNLLLYVFKEYIIQKKNSWGLFNILRLLKTNKKSALYQYDFLNNIFTENLTFNKFIIIQRELLKNIENFNVLQLYELVILLFSVTNTFYNESNINKDILFLSLGHIYRSRIKQKGKLYQEYKTDVLNVKNILVSGIQTINKYILSISNEAWLNNNKNDICYLTMICILTSLSRCMNNEFINKSLVYQENMIQQKLKD